MTQQEIVALLDAEGTDTAHAARDEIERLQGEVDRLKAENRSLKFAISEDGLEKRAETAEAKLNSLLKAVKGVTDFYRCSMVIPPSYLDNLVYKLNELDQYLPDRTRLKVLSVEELMGIAQSSNGLSGYLTTEMVCRAIHKAIYGGQDGNM